MINKFVCVDETMQHVWFDLLKLMVHPKNVYIMCVLSDVKVKVWLLGLSEEGQKKKKLLLHFYLFITKNNLVCCEDE